MAPEVTTTTVHPALRRSTTSRATLARASKATPPAASVTEVVPILTTRLRVAIALAQIQATVSRQSFATRGPVVVAAVEPGAHFVAPPFEGQRSDRDDIAVDHARTR